MAKRILHIVTNAGQYDNGDPTGLWLSGLTTAWDRFEREGFEQDIASPRGGDVPLDPRSLKFPFRNESAKSWLNNQERMALLKNTPPIRSVDPNTYDAICLAGGHGAMFDFTHNSELHNLIASVYERGAIVASVGHGYCGILNVRLSDGSYLVNGKILTGPSWREEKLALVSQKVPYNAEELARERGAEYICWKRPYRGSAAVTNGLVTGHNNFSSADTVASSVCDELARLDSLKAKGSEPL